jgi:hypothetical protein
MRKGIRLPSPAMIVAIIALIVGLGSGAYAAKLKLGKNAVKTKNIKNLAVTEAKIANGAATEAKIANGAISEAKIADGARGRAVGYAQVLSSGTVGPNSSGISNANVTRTGSGATTVYCLHGMPKHGTVVVTPGFGATEFDGIVSANLDQAPLNQDANECSSVPGTQAAVFTYYDDFFGAINPARSPQPFFVALFQ